MTIEKSRFNSEAAPQSYVSQKKFLKQSRGIFPLSGLRVSKFASSIWMAIRGLSKDVCEALEIADHKVALRRLDADEKGVCLTPTPVDCRLCVLSANRAFTN
jgi:hypothetical protein